VQTRRSSIPAFLLAILTLWPASVLAQERERVLKTPERAKISDAFFSDPAVRVFDLQISEAALSQLQQSPRTYVTAELKEGETLLRNVAVRLKGVSSFRSILQKASFAIKFDEFVENQTYRGLKKLMFNNSVQDRTYVSELLATELFREAGLPAARVTHARMRLNGRDLGLYVVVEAMNKDFLKRHFGSAKGNLYEAFLQDVDGRLEQDNGEDESRADIQALCAACAIEDPAARWQRLNEVLDVKSFVEFIAMEMLTTHWDGYAVHFNNYRLYNDPNSGRMVFIPHGLDSLFRRPDCSIEPPQTSVVGTAVLTTPEGRKLYDEAIRRLAKNVFKPSAILERMEEALTKLRGAGLERSEIAKIERYAEVMRERIQLRATRVDEQLGGMKPVTIKFDSAGVGTPVTWREEPDRGEPMFEREKHQGKEALHIRARQESTRASWRSVVYLEPGTYRFEGLVCTEMLSGSARLRVSADSARMVASGTSPWQPLNHVFTVERAPMDIELICELNAQQGDAWFDVGSLRVRRINSNEPTEIESSGPRALRRQLIPAPVPGRRPQLVK
jgi:spore coat protein H